MSVDSNFVLQQLKSLPSQVGLKIMGDKAMIKCPWHKAGRENTPSLSIALKEGKNFAVGTWGCFACSIQKELKNQGVGGANWATLATKLNLDTGGPQKKLSPVAPTKQELEWLDEELFSAKQPKQLEIEAERAKISKFKFSAVEWRGIPGKLVKEVGGVEGKNKYGYNRVYLPIMVNGEWNSGIWCAYAKEKLSYVYDGDKKVNQSLYPYDYIQHRIKKIKSEGKSCAVVLVEGPRDALHLIANGILALAVLGGITAWNKDKLKLLLDLNVDFVVIAPDPDEIGDKLYKAVKADLKKHNVPSLPFEMKHEFVVVKDVKGKATKVKKKLEDPGDLTPKRIKQLKLYIEEYLP